MFLQQTNNSFLLIYKPLNFSIMKSIMSSNALSKSKLKALIWLVFIVIMSWQTLLSQDNTAKTSAFYPSFGLGIGFFYPSDVNDYIDFDMAYQGVEGTFNTDLYMYLEVKAGLTYRMKSFDVTGGLEYDVAPKFVVVDGGSSGNLTYFYHRLSPEISANYYISNKNGKNAFFIGGGINYSFLSFEEFKASAPGFKVQLGYSMQFGKFNLQPYGAFRYTKATDSSNEMGDFELDYTGGQIGVNMSFHPRILYK
jgi:hypothetical protein